MKKNYNSLIPVMVFLFVCGNAGAQSDFKNVFKINPFSLAVGSCTISYERQVSDNVTVVLGVNFMPEPLKPFGTLFSCNGVTPEVRFYLSYLNIDVPSGGYVAPFARYRCFSISLPGNLKDTLGYSTKQTFCDDQFALGVTLGYQWITEKGFSFDFFAGPYLNENHFRTDDGTVIPVVYNIGFLGNDGIGFRVGGTVGFAF